SIAVTPATPTIPAGTGQKFAATGTFADNSTQILQSVVWSSSNAAVATTTNDSSNSGEAITSAQGAVTITACDGSICGSSNLTAGPPALVAIAVTSPNPSVGLGLTQQFAAIGTYTDGSTQDLTGSVVWTSSATSVATVSATGLASTLAQGSAAITATSGAISGSTTFIVAPPAVVSVALTPATVTLPAGLSQQLTATATYSDGSTRDVTNIITFGGSSNPSVADGIAP